MPFAPTPASGYLSGQPSALQVFGVQTFGAPTVVGRMRVTLQSPSSAAATIISLLKNGSAVASATLPIGGQDSGNVDFGGISFAATDVLSFQATSFSLTDTPSGITALAYWSYVIVSGIGLFYSDPIDEIKSHLRMIGIGAGDTDSLSPDDILKRQARCDRWIDGRLRSVYLCPLVVVTRGSDQRYPDPIPEIARRWIAGTIVMDCFTDVQPNQQESAKAYIAQAEAELAQCLLPLYRLEGQRLKSRNPGSDPQSEPLHPAGAADAATPSSPMIAGS